MAITKFQVLNQGVPVVGATIIVGEVGELEKTTDANGIVAYPNITGSYAGFADVWIDSSVVTATAKVVIKAGETSIIELGVKTE